MMQKSWFLVGVFMGWDTGFKCVSTEKWCFSYIIMHPLGVIHNTTGFILLKPRPTRGTFSGWKRTCRSWEVTYWVWPTSQLAIDLRFVAQMRSMIGCRASRALFLMGESISRSANKAVLTYIIWVGRSGTSEEGLDVPPSCLVKEILF